MIKTNHILVFLFGVFVHFHALAYDFVYNNIYYKILSTQDKTVEVAPSPDKYKGAISIPSSVTFGGVRYTITSIGYNAFKDCIELTSLKMGNSITSIDSHACSGCKKMSTLVLSNMLSKIGNDAFYQCEALKSVDIPATMTYIPDDGFMGCTSLEFVNLPETIEKLYRAAFSGCRNLKTINLPESLTYIGDVAFWFCSNIESIVVPRNVSYIGERAFEGAFSNGFSVAKDNACYCAVDNVLFDKEMSKLIWCQQTKAGSYEIPNTVVEIAPFAFYQTSLETVGIPSSVETIGSHAFWSSQITSLKLPATINEIGANAFKYCYKLTELTCLASTPPKCGSEIFQSSIKAGTLIVPKNVLSTYKYASQWKDWGTLIGIDVPVCPSPSIVYEDNSLRFDSDVEGTLFKFTLEPIADFRTEGTASTINLQPVNKYRVKVWAVADGYAVSAPTEQVIESDLLDFDGDGITSVGDVTVMINMLK